MRLAGGRANGIEQFGILVCPPFLVEVGDLPVDAVHYLVEAGFPHGFPFPQFGRATNGRFTHTLYNHTEPPV
jgi:hypothetical protein